MKSLTSHINSRALIIRLVLIALLALLIPSISHSQTSQPVVPTNTSGLPENYTLLEPLPCVPGSGCVPNQQIETVNFKQYVQYMFNLLIALAAVSAVFVIVWGGLQYMTSDSWQQKRDGLTRARNAILGLLLVLCSYLILRTIDPRLVEVPETFVPPLADCRANPGSVLCRRTAASDLMRQLETRMARLQTQVPASQRDGFNQSQGQFNNYQQTVTRLEEERAAELRTHQPVPGGASTDRGQEFDVDFERINQELAAARSGALATVSSQEMMRFGGWQAEGINMDTQGWIDSHQREVDRIYLDSLLKLEGLSNPADQEALEILNTSYSEALIKLNERRTALRNRNRQ